MQNIFSEVTGVFQSGIRRAAPWVVRGLLAASLLAPGAGAALAQDNAPAAAEETGEAQERAATTQVFFVAPQLLNDAFLQARYDSMSEELRATVSRQNMRAFTSPADAFAAAQNNAQIFILGGGRVQGNTLVPVVYSSTAPLVLDGRSNVQVLSVPWPVAGADGQALKDNTGKVVTRPAILEFSPPQEGAATPGLVIRNSQDIGFGGVLVGGNVSIEASTNVIFVSGLAASITVGAGASDVTLAGNTVGGIVIEPRASGVEIAATQFIVEPGAVAITAADAGQFTLGEDVVFKTVQEGRLVDVAPAQVMLSIGGEQVSLEAFRLRIPGGVSSAVDRLTASRNAASQHGISA